MKIKQIACALLLAFSLSANAANTITKVAQVSTEVTLSDNVDYVITNETPFTEGGSVNITNTEHAVLIIQNIRPSHILSQKLLNGHVYINGVQAINGENCQVRMYANGSIIFPYTKDIKPLTVYSKSNFGGMVVDNFGLEHTGGFMNSLTEEQLNNRIRSFKLKRGYMVTFATGLNGWGYSRCFIADKEDLEFAELPIIFDNRISSYRIFQWHDVQKKGLASDTRVAQNDMLSTTYCYDWAAGFSHLPDRECVPHQIYVAWPSAADCGKANYACHMQTNNEPGNSADDHPQSVEVILDQWQELMRTGMRLCSESSHDGSWSHLDQFIAEVDARGWRCDILDLHCYWASGFGNMEYYYNKYGKRPIWITEFVWGASWNNNGIFATDRSFSIENQQKNLNEMKNILTTLNNSPYVERYAYWNSEADCSKLLRGENEMSLTGEYYRDMKSGIAYRKEYEKVPNVVYTAPQDFTGSWKSQTLGTFSLSWKDSNGDMLSKILLLRKKDDAATYDTLQVIKPEDLNGKFRHYSYTDTLTEKGNYTYFVVNVTADGSLRNSPNTVEAAKSNIKGTADIQYGELSLLDINPITVQFTEKFDAAPAVFMGAVSNNNTKFYPGNLVTNVKTSSFTYQLFPWLTSPSTTLDKEETIPYMAMKMGNYMFDTMPCEVAKVSAYAMDTTQVTFATPFPEGVIPIVLTETRNQKEFPISIKLRDVSNTGFKCILLYEDESGKKPSSIPTTIYYMAVAPGIGTIDKENGILIAAGKGDTPLSGTFGTSVNFLWGEESVRAISPYIFANLQTTNYESATLVRQWKPISKDGYTIGSRFIRVVDSSRKQAADGTTLDQTIMKDDIGWVIIYEYVDGVSVSTQIKNLQSTENESIRPYIENNTIRIEGAEEFEVYDMRGFKLTSHYNPSPGIYIVKAENKTAMLLVK